MVRAEVANPGPCGPLFVYFGAHGIVSLHLQHAGTALF